MIQFIDWETSDMRKHFVEFIGRPNRMHTDRARVTLSYRGVFVLNGKAYEALEMPAAVTLHYDEDERVIALKPVDARLPNAFPVKQKDNFKYRMINASPFCRHFRIRIERTVLFNEVDIDNDGVMMLELRNTTSIARGRW